MRCSAIADVDASLYRWMRQREEARNGRQAGLVIFRRNNRTEGGEVVSESRRCATLDGTYFKMYNQIDGSIHAVVEPQENLMKRTWTIIGVAEVARSFKWYQSLFGQDETSPGHDYFGQIHDTDGTVLLCLHQWGAHEHPSLTSPERSDPGNGLLLFFRVDDFEDALSRARSLVIRLEEEPQVNPNTGTKEFALRDPDGYYIMISALDAA